MGFKRVSVSLPMKIFDKLKRLAARHYQNNKSNAVADGVKALDKLYGRARDDRRFAALEKERKNANH